MLELPWPASNSLGPKEALTGVNAPDRDFAAAWTSNHYAGVACVPLELASSRTHAIPA